jgi:hypothetical protein
MSRMLTSNFTQEVTPGLRKVYFSTLKNIAQEFRQVFNLIPEEPGHGAGLNFFEDLRVASLGTFAAKPQGQAITYDIPQEETKVRYTPYTFGLGYRITEEMQEDELYGLVERLTTELGMSAMHQMEVQSFRILNNAFGTTGGGTGFGATGFASEGLISTSHALVRGGTAKNRAATDLDMGITSLEQAIDIFETNANESNMPVPLKPALLLIPPQLKWVARELTESELKPYTGNNEVNPLGGEGLQYMVCHYLSATGTWFLIGPKAQHDMNVWIRRQPRYNVGDDFDTGDAKAKGAFRIASGHGDWRGVFGSQGQ